MTPVERDEASITPPVVRAKKTGPILYKHAAPLPKNLTSEKPSKASGAAYDANRALKIFGPIGPERKVVYSLLNSLMVIACRVATPRTPCWLSATIFSATRRVAGSSIAFRPKVLQTLSSASDISWIVSGSNASPERKGRIGTVSPTRWGPCN
jgi:hypothetical protein